MIILKIYLIISWLIGIGIMIYAANHWEEINYDEKYTTLNPNIILPLVAVFFPIIIPIMFISAIFEKRDNGTE